MVKALPFALVMVVLSAQIAEARFVIVTRMVKDINVGSGASDPGPFAVLGKNVVFAAGDATHGRELWISNGTPRGTKLLMDINPGIDDSSPHNFLSDGPFVYFVAF